MAKKDGKTFLSRPPTHRPIADISKNGFCSLDWIQFFDLLVLRVGGTYAKSSKNIEDSNIENAETINDLKKSLEIIDKNIKNISGFVDENKEEIEKLINQSKIDHESIVTSAQKIQAIEEEIVLINKMIELLSEKLENVNEKLNKIEVVSSLPNVSDDEYNNKIIEYNNELYYKLLGEWKKINVT